MVLWGYTPKECAPYLEHQIKAFSIYEGLLSLGTKGKGMSPISSNVEDEYCRACKAVHKDKDCSTCSHNIKVISDGK